MSKVVSCGHKPTKLVGRSVDHLDSSHRRGHFAIANHEHIEVARRVGLRPPSPRADKDNRLSLLLAIGRSKKPAKVLSFREVNRRRFHS